MNRFLVRNYTAEDFDEWVRLRSALWPEIPAASAEEEAHAWLALPGAAVLVAVEAEGDAGLAGFAEVGERPYADGCDTSPVAYLEGWYVNLARRGRGVGRALIEAAVQWARERGYREMGSDALLEEVGSQRAHERVGFEEVERAVRYRRTL